MTNRAIYLLLAYLLLPGLAFSTILRASRQPVFVNLRRVRALKTNETERTPAGRGARTVPLLFQQYLGITPGEPFQFDLTKWRQLQGCGLFENLTARSVARNDGTVSLVISGDELPSITFAPDVSVGTSITNPEVSGGILLRDNNFRGFGDRLEFTLSAFNKGIEAGLSDLPPSIHLKWIDGIKGRPDSVTLFLDNDHVIEDYPSVLPRFAREEPEPVLHSNVGGPGKRINSGGRRPLEISRVALLFQGSRNGKSGGSLSYELEPYNTVISMRSRWGEHLHLSGSKMKLSLKSAWPSLDLNFDSGNAILNRGVGVASSLLRSQSWWSKPSNSHAATRRDTYRSAGMDVSFPQVLLFDLKSRGNGTSATPLQVVGQAKLRLLKSWGRGCVPLYHFPAIDDARCIRGFTAPTPTFEPKVPLYSILKLDAFMEGLTFGTPGVFLDAGRFVGFRNSGENQQPSASVVGKLVTIGLSLKSNSLRLDLGWPCSVAPKTFMPKLSLALDM